MLSGKWSLYWMYGIYILEISMRRVQTVPLPSDVMKWLPEACDREKYFRYNGCNETASFIYRRNCREIRRLLKEAGMFHQYSSYEALNAPKDRYELNNGNPACIEDEMLTLSQTEVLLEHLTAHSAPKPTLTQPKVLLEHLTAHSAPKPAHPSDDNRIVHDGKTQVNPERSSTWVGGSHGAADDGPSRGVREKYLRAWRDAAHRVRRGALALPENKWTSPIRYKVDAEIASQKSWSDAVQAAVQAWANATCLDFEQIPVTANITEPHLLFTFLFYPTCSSYIGQIPSIVPQPIYLGVLCYTMGVIAHEIGHALGLIHEHQRPDRDQYITLEPQNRVGNSDSFFTLFNSSIVQTYGQPYDYGSDMHYGGTAYSLSGSLTIRTNDPLYQGTLGQRLELSFWDTYAINIAYCSDVCDPTDLEQACLHRGYQDPKNCSRCRCPAGWSGQYCETVAPPVNADCGGTLMTTYSLGTASFPPMGGANASSTYNPGQQCTWLIESPPNTSILFQFQGDFGVACSSLQGNMCLDWVEVRYQLDLGLSGPRFCCGQRPTVELVSATNRILVNFRALSPDSLSQQRSGFTFSYQINVDCQLTPCHNSGQCISNSAGRFACQCVSGYSGSFCSDTASSTTRVKLGITPPVDTTAITTTTSSSIATPTASRTTSPTTHFASPSTTTQPISSTTTSTSTATSSTPTQTSTTTYVDSKQSQLSSSLIFTSTTSPQPSTSTISILPSSSSTSLSTTPFSRSSAISRRQTPLPLTTTSTKTTTNQAFSFSPFQSTPGFPSPGNEGLPSTTVSTTQIKTTDYFQRVNDAPSAVSQLWMTTNYYWKESERTPASGQAALRQTPASFEPPKSNIVSATAAETLPHTTTLFAVPKSNILTEYPFKTSSNVDS